MNQVEERPLNRAWIADLLRRNRYLVLATSDGARPWIAPLEYVLDDELNLYFFSPRNVRHSRDLEHNARVAVAVFDSQQPEYTPEMSFTISGVQIDGTASLLDEAEYPAAIVAGIKALNPPMPPYAVYRIVPERFFVPRIENGINVRVEVGAG